MYYFNDSMRNPQAMLPKILAEDTGTAELRDPMFCAKTPFRFRRPNLLGRRKNSPSPCACYRPRRHPASC